MPSPAPLTDPGRPSQFGQYRVIGALGVGGMSVIHRAVDERSGVEVAIKTVDRPRLQAMEALRAEVRALRRVQVPGVVRFIDSGTAGGLPWYAMELVEGLTWSAWLGHRLDASTIDPDSFDSDFGDANAGTRSVPRSVSPVLALARHLTSTLAVLHARGIVHRDLKPANVFIRNDGTTVLMDLGLAWRVRGAVGRENLDVAGPTAGTLAYISPEHLRGAPSDARSDLFSLGVILYESLTGTLPWPNVGVNAPRMPPAPPSALVDGVPSEVDALVLGLLEVDPARRTAYAVDLIERFVALGAPAPTEPPPRLYLYRPEMTGRDEAFARIEASVARVVAGHGGVTVLLGESGIGKTFLAAEAANHAWRHGCRLVRGECAAGRLAGSVVDPTSTPFLPFAPLLQHIADRARGETPEWRGKVLGDRGPVLGAWLPNSATMVAAAAELEGQANLTRLVRALRDTLGALVGEDGPMFLVLDDIQWADELSLAFLEALSGDWTARHPVGVLATCRSEGRTADVDALLAAPGVETIGLTRLGSADIARAVSGMLALPEVPPELLAVVERESEGNPFFVAEYVRAALADGALTRVHGSWQLRGGDRPLPQPRSMHDYVGMRLDTLDATSVALLSLAAVIGKEFDSAQLVSLGGQAEDVVAARLVDLVSRQVLEEPDDQGRFRFVHDKVRQAAYERIPADRCRALHRAVADALAATAAPAVLALHWRAAEDWPRAIDASERAAEEALRRGACHDALRHLRAAGDIARSAGIEVGRLRRARWERMMAESHFDVGEEEEGGMHVRRALAELGEPPVPASAAGQGFVLLGAIGVRILHAYTGSWWSRPTPDEEYRISEAALVYNRLLEPSFRQNLPVLGSYVGVRGLNLALRARPSVALARGFGFMSYVVSLTPLKVVAKRWSDQAIRLAEELGHPATLVYALHRTAAYLTSVGELKEAGARLERGQAIAESVGDRRQGEEGMGCACSVLQAQGRLEELERVARALRTRADERHDLITGGWARINLVESLSRRRRFEDADAVVRELEAWIPRAGEGELAWYHGAVADLALRRGDVVAARSAAQAGLAIVKKQPPVAYFVREGVVELAMVMLELYERARREGADVQTLAVEARDAVKGLTAFTRLSPYAGPWARVAEARLARIEGRSPDWRLTEALALAEQMGTPGAAGLAHEERGHTGDAQGYARAEAVYAAAGMVDDEARVGALRRGQILPPGR